MSIADAFESIDNGDTARVVKELYKGLMPMPIMPTLSVAIPGFVRIDPDKVRDIAEQCKAVLNSFSENTDTFADSIKGLADNWEGKSYSKYEQETLEIVKALREIADNFSEFISKIVTAANRYEEIDNSL